MNNMFSFVLYFSFFFKKKSKKRITTGQKNVKVSPQAAPDVVPPRAFSFLDRNKTH